MRCERTDYEWAAIKSMLCQIQDGKGKSVSEYLMNWDWSAPKAPQHLPLVGEVGASAPGGRLSHSPVLACGTPSLALPHKGGGNPPPAWHGFQTNNHPTIYAAPPVAISSPASFSISVCATATRAPSRTTRPVAMKYLPRPGRR